MNDRLKKWLGDHFGVDLKNNYFQGRIALETVHFDQRCELFVGFLETFEHDLKVTYRIEFWDSLFDIRGIVLPFNPTFYNEHPNDEVPGEVCFTTNCFNRDVASNILNRHFNFEQALIPSLNIRVQFCFFNDRNLIVVDVYDDRGCNILFLRR